ncbi:hypothetical protein M404DRAFT_508052 [Pisolithus tinctorius Marx 270]|uniref:Uncharacterized protein n=1 Tax=Pisolithus tinctorius Marx 270 TaxID=870435 RepID=A0A0C3NYM4_PISTI|nr:hypothetical protein M404DRAFT_508052 [Pisolithus tinctorius Marx 270]
MHVCIDTNVLPQTSTAHTSGRSPGVPMGQRVIAQTQQFRLPRIPQLRHQALLLRERMLLKFLSNQSVGWSSLPRQWAAFFVHNARECALWHLRGDCKL